MPRRNRIDPWGDRRHPLAASRMWTPLFFLDDAVALAAGHRPCGECRRADYTSYRRAVAVGTEAAERVTATALNRLLAREKLRPGRGLRRAGDRIVWTAALADLPPGTVVVPQSGRHPHLVTGRGVRSFGFAGWGPTAQWPATTLVGVLTPPTSVTALRHGFSPRLHPTATGPDGESGDESAAGPHISEPPNVHETWA